VNDCALRDALARLSAGEDLTADQAAAAVGVVVAGRATDAALAALLTAWRIKGETAAELAGAVRAVHAQMTPFARSGAPVVDTCGTGGDGAQTVNVSTGAAILVAACGVRVAKHGNRSASGNSGSADVLAELGVAIDVEISVLTRCLDQLGIAFLFAPRFHPALRHAAQARKALPFPTVFNLIGPLANPALPDYQLIGVASERAARLVAHARAALGTRRAAVVIGNDGLDEVTLSGPTRVCWVEDGIVRELTWMPEDFGLPRTDLSSLRVKGPAESAERLCEVLRGKTGPLRDVLLANAAAALYVAGCVESLRDGVERAGAAIDSGAAGELLERWAVLSGA
jgi:anthranilate phosphoribosyltransferase